MPLLNHSNKWAYGAHFLSNNHRGLHVQLWIWILDLVGDVNIVELAQSCGVFQGEMQFWSGNSSRERSIEIYKSGKVGQSKIFDTKHWATGFGVCPAGFQPCFSQCFLITFGMVMYILSHCVLELHFISFDFIRITMKILILVSEDTMDFELLNCVEIL